MKTCTLTPTPPLIQAIQKALATAGAQPCVCLGLDLELHGAQGAAIIGGGTPLDLGKQDRRRDQKEGRGGLRATPGR